MAFAWQRCKYVVFTMALAILAVIVIQAETGCVAWMAHTMISTRREARAAEALRDADPEELRRRGVAMQFRVDAGPPPASLIVWVVDPPQLPPRGTILFVHGLSDRKETMTVTAQSHAARGYRGVTLDLRGQGESGGPHLGFGVLESRDLSQVIDELERRGLLAGKLGVYGCSYGAAVAVQVAGRDPRVAACVAISPFSSMREVVFQHARNCCRLDLLAGARRIDEAIALAGRIAEFAPQEASARDAAATSAAHFLLFAGRNDTTVPWQQTDAIAQAAPQRSRLMLVDGEDHTTLTRDRTGVIWREATGWFDQWLTPSAP